MIEIVAFSTICGFVIGFLISEIRWQTVINHILEKNRMNIQK